MLQELKEALKAEVALVKPIRAKIRATHGMERWHARVEKRSRGEMRRHLHLACCYMRGTPYRKCEADPADAPSADRIRGLLEEYGCCRATPPSMEDANCPVESWLGVPPVKVEQPKRVSRLYVVVRADLPPGSQAVQAAHAMREFAADYPEIEKAWHEKSNTVAMLSVPDEAALVELLESLSAALHFTPFREPDLGGSLTAICVEPKGGRTLRHLPLALRTEAA